MSTTAYTLAREAYAAQGVDPEAALETLAHTSLSLHCWQGDDVRGFEAGAGEPGGGLAVTGAYPGRARTPEELRADLDQALALLPGRHRVNLHASYAELGGAKVDRDTYEAAHFRGWIEWAKARGLGLDFNPTYFGHPLAQSGLTLTHPDAGVRRFWIAHGIACRRIAGEMGRALGSATMTNVWIPDGSKDLTVDRRGPRERLAQSLDAVFAEAIDPALAIDAVESKLFGLGSEAYVAGSHEFYLGYAITRQKYLCLDTGHFHPTESIADKISSVLQFVPGLLLHVSRGVRWDSDHVVIQDDATRAIFEELVRGQYLGRARVGLDYFDASINRVAAWVIGARAALKAWLAALLEPTNKLQEMELGGDFTARLALLEEVKALPLGAVWEEYCQRHNVPAGMGWLAEVQRYEREVLVHRG